MRQDRVDWSGDIHDLLHFHLERKVTWTENALRGIVVESIGSKNAAIVIVHSLASIVVVCGNRGVHVIGRNVDLTATRLKNESNMQHTSEPLVSILFSPSATISD